MSPAELIQLAQNCIDDINTSVVGIEMQRDERLRAMKVPWLNDISQLKRKASIEWKEYLTGLYLLGIDRYKECICRHRRH